MKALEGEIVNPRTSVNLTKQAKMLHALSNDYNIVQSCMYAGISKQTYYNWLEDPSFAEKVEQAKSMIGMKAKENVIGAITQGDIHTSKWYLERRDSAFKSKADVEVHPGQTKTHDKLKEFMNDTDDGAYDDPSSEPPAAPTAEGGTEVAPSPSDIPG